MTKSIPLIRLSSVNPFLLELRRRGLNAEGLLREMNLPTDIPASPEIFLASSAVYELVERTADVADDPFLGFGVGRQLDLTKWDPARLAAEQSRTIGGLLSRFTVNVEDHSSAGQFYLHIAGKRSTFGLRRFTRPSIALAQNDSFYLGFMSQMLSRSLLDQWNPQDCMFRVVDPDCVPAGKYGFRVAKGNRRGIQVTLPTSWLFAPNGYIRPSVDGEFALTSEMPGSLVESVRIALRPHLSDMDLTVAKAAKVCGFERRRLSRSLREAGTTLSKEIAKMRAESAEHDLVNTDRRIADIAQSVGFKDPTTFSRAFKGWTGQSPQAYRRTHTSSS